MLEMLSTVMPVILLFILGVWCKKVNFISEVGIKDIKKFLINIALPSVLFQTFMDMEISMEHIIMLCLTFILLLLFMIFGRMCNFVPSLKYKYNPYVCTAYSFGLVGFALFSMIYGEDKLEIFSVMGLAHEIFVWTLYYLIFRIDTQNKKMGVETLVNLLKSPIIISIFIGITLNLTGLTSILYTQPLAVGIFNSIAYIASTATPFMLICLGYGLSFDMKYVKRSLKLVALRIGVIGIVGLIFKILVIDNFVESTMLLNVSYISFLILPPMFSLPLLVAENGNQEDTDIVNTAVGIYTLLSILAFILFAFFVPIELL